MRLLSHRLVNCHQRVLATLQMGVLNNGYYGYHPSSCASTWCQKRQTRQNSVLTPSRSCNDRFLSPGDHLMLNGLFQNYTSLVRGSRHGPWSYQESIQLQEEFHAASRLLSQSRLHERDLQKLFQKAGLTGSRSFHTSGSDKQNQPQHVRSGLNTLLIHIQVNIYRYWTHCAAPTVCL